MHVLSFCLDGKNCLYICGEKSDSYMKSMIKIAAVTLAASFLFSMTACNKSKGHNGKTITPDMPWYEVKPFEIDAGIDPKKELEFKFAQIIGSDEKNIAVLTSGSYKYPDDVNWKTFDSSKYQFMTVSILDKTTRKTVRFFDLNELSQEGFLNTATFESGKLTVLVSNYDMNTDTMTSRSVILDALTGEQLDARDSGTVEPVQKIYTIGKYKVQLCAVWNESIPSYSLIVTQPDGTPKKFEIKDDSAKISYIYNVVQLSEKTALIIASSDNVYDFYVFDLTSGMLTKQNNKDYDWLDLLSVTKTQSCSDGSVYSLDSTGIAKLDFNKKTSEQLVNFSWSNLDRNLVRNLSIADVYDGSFILYGEKPLPRPYSHVDAGVSSDFVMYELKKSDKNPHAGKGILELFSPSGYANEDINDAINKFNSTNRDFFIELTDRYTTNIASQYSNAKNEDESDNITLNYSANTSNKLAIDIMNGEGPDMLLNVDSYGVLKNSNYLMDLSSYASNMSSDKYFTNVLEATKVDGKLYTMPISFGISGIQTDSKYAATTGVGFTTEEYIKFLKETLNGKDLITSGQAYYFSTLFDNMSEKFISNGKADFTGPEFAALADYVKNNVQEKSPDWTKEEPTTIVDTETRTEIQKAIYVSINGYWDYIQAVENTNGCSSILGLPSSDGRGPTVFAYDSIAISTQTKDPDACVEFMKLLISDNTQKELASKGYLVLNRKAFRDAGNKAVEYFNTLNPGYPNGYYGGSKKAENYVTYTSEHIKSLEKAIDSCTNTSSSDAAISIILIEEMPSYFTGQKELGDVIKIAQDRVQKVLNERK